MIPLSPVDPPAPFVVAAAADDRPQELAMRRRQAADVLERSVGPDHTDDRFEPYERPTDGSVLVLAHLGDRSVAYVMATSSRGRFQLDVAADRHAIADAAGDDPDSTLETLLLSMIDQATVLFDDQSPVPSTKLTFELWGRPRQDWHERLACRLGLMEHRSLHQMRCPLPVPTGDPRSDRTRPLDPDVDSARMLAVNNRAFSYHPDQSNQKLSDFEAAFSDPSFRPESVRILDPDPTDSRAADHPMVGFCWTKIHPARPSRTALGEIHVIAVDPAYHGEGHGTGLTAAGLGWLVDQGLDTGMLYVESDNEPAVATYRKLGFTVHGTYTAWSPS